MFSLTWIIFAVVFATFYLSNIIADRLLDKKWNFNIGILLLVTILIISGLFAHFSYVFTNNYIAKNVPNHWEEKIVETEKISDVVRSCEKQGSFFFGIGNVNEVETFRYNIINDDGSIIRGKLETSRCYIHKAEKGKQKFVLVKKVRVYKNPEDKKFYENSGDEKSGFYRAYL